MNLGAGRVVWQELTRIDAAIRKGTFRDNPAMADLLAELKDSGGRLHLMGLVSDGGVHSHQNHLVALAQWAQAAGVPTTIHAFLDGRDTEQKSADGYLQWLAFQLRGCPLVTIGSLCGRYYAMDRDKRWDRVERAWKLLVDGVAESEAEDAQAGIKAAYGRGETDEFVTPTRLGGFQPIAGRRRGHLLQLPRRPGPGAVPRPGRCPASTASGRQRRPKVRLVTFTAYEKDLEPYVRSPTRPRTWPTSWASWWPPAAGSSCAPPRPRSTPT